MRSQAPFGLALAVSSALASLHCKTTSTETATMPSAKPVPKAESTTADASTMARAPVEAGPSSEAPLAWGTRPPENGPLYPVVDGMCVHAEVWRLDDGGALFTYGNGLGPWTRGSSTTIARFVDSGLDTSASVTRFGKRPSLGPDSELELAPLAAMGAWPEPLVLYSNDQGGARTRDFPSVWKHGADGWSVVASYAEPRQPSYGRPVVFKGHAILARGPGSDEGQDSEQGIAVRAEPLISGAAPLPDVGLLSRAKAWPRTLAASDDAIYLLFSEEGSAATRVRAWRDGKVRELPVANGDVSVVTAKPTLHLMVDKRKLLRLDGDALVDVTPKTALGWQMRAVSVSTGGDAWILLKKGTEEKVVVAKKGEVSELALPEPSLPARKEAVMHWPTAGALLAGADVDDVWVSARGGILYHREGGAFRVVDMPKPPFATTGHYLAQAIVVAAKGDVYVNAGYAEKGMGWRTSERYRAILRSKRPAEVLRCNEPHQGWESASGGGFMSFPPIADDGCREPFAVLLRTAYRSGKETSYVFERSGDFPSVRVAIKEALGADAGASAPAVTELVELDSGTQRYLGAKVPSVAAGRALAASVAKKVRGGVETRPEIVCGSPPKVERVIRVDTATGKVIP